MMRERWMMGFVSCWMLVCCHAAYAQSGSASDAVAPQDPGYGLYYHDPQGEPNVATRWGYHDGWQDGRLDRNHGSGLRAQDNPHYRAPIDHGTHSGMTRDQYSKAYRVAYVRGYEHGSRL